MLKGRIPVEGEIREYKDGPYKYIDGHWKKVKPLDKKLEEHNNSIKEKRVGINIGDIKLLEGVKVEVVGFASLGQPGGVQEEPPRRARRPHQRQPARPRDPLGADDLPLGGRQVRADGDGLLSEDVRPAQVDLLEGLAVTKRVELKHDSHCGSRH